MGKSSEQIIQLELISRKSPLYENFEERTNLLNDTEIAYIFCKECEKRAKPLSFIKVWFECRDKSIDDTERKNYPLIYNNKFEALKKIDEDFYFYYNNLFESLTTQELDDSINPPYSVKTMIDEPILLKTLGVNRVDELLYNGFPKEIQDNKGFPHLDFKYLLIFLKDDEVKKIKNHIKLNDFGYRTVISRTQTNSYLVDIDFTKPIEDIEQYIRSIKNDFDTNPKSLPTMYDLLNIKQKTLNLYTLKSEIYKKNNLKSNSQILADVLFIYDCYQARYSQEDIQQEFKLKYDNKIGIKKESIKKYLDFAKEYIYKEKYLDFLRPQYRG